MGAEIKGFYLMMGQYDAVVIVEAPNDETIAKVSLASGTRGTVRSGDFACLYRRRIPQNPCIAALKKGSEVVARPLSRSDEANISVASSRP